MIKKIYNETLKKMYIRITNTAYFLTDILNWQALWGKQKYLVNCLYEKRKNVNSKESVSSKNKKIN